MHQLHSIPGSWGEGSQAWLPAKELIPRDAEPPVPTEEEKEEEEVKGNGRS